jgi:tetratricopeptide (TPR) repeat protein
MYTIYLSLSVALFAGVVPALFGVSIAWTTLPAIVLGVLAFVWFNRRMARRVEAVTQAADAEIAALQQVASRQPTTPAQVKQIQAQAAARIDAAVAILQRGFVFERWQIGVRTMLNARIGMLLFTKWAQLGVGEPAAAIPALRGAVVRGKKATLLASLWPAWAMLAVCEYKAGDLGAARRVLDDAVKVAKKEGLLWSLYAWILCAEGLTEDAIDVLARGKAKSVDDRLVANLVALQNGKKISLREYGEQWYQFGLEKPRMASPETQQKLTQPRMGHPRMRLRGGRR